MGRDLHYFYRTYYADSFLNSADIMRRDYLPPRPFMGKLKEGPFKKKEGDYAQVITEIKKATSKAAFEVKERKGTPQLNLGRTEEQS